jgi:hypothetical protein
MTNIDPKFMDMNLFCLRIFAILTIVGFSMSISAQNPTSNAVWHTFVADTGKWHPEEIHIVYAMDSMTLAFKLPYEENQSGVHNLLFQSNESGTIHLLDTINNVYNERWFTRLIPGKYDAILLYNNGNYIKYRDVAFEKNTSAEVDMRKLKFQPSDSKSQSWLTLRTFNAPVGDRGTLSKNYTTVYEKRGRGYVFLEEGPALMNKLAVIKIDSDKSIMGTLDGYIEFEFDLNQKIKIVSLSIAPYEITLPANSGLFVVTEESQFSKEVRKYESTIIPCCCPVKKQ